MTNVITNLGSILNTDYLFTNLGTLLPVMGGVLIFSFTFYQITKLIIGIYNVKHGPKL